MKKVLIMAIALVGLTAMAQQRERDGSKRVEKSQLTVEQMATLQTKRMTLALDLSTEQQNQVQSLNLEQAKIRKTKMEERKARKDSEDTEKPTSEERYAMKAAMLDHKIAHKAEMKKILSDEQYTRWEKMAKRRGKYKRGKGKKGKGEKQRLEDKKL